MKLEVDNKTLETFQTLRFETSIAALVDILIFTTAIISEIRVNDEVVLRSTGGVLLFTGKVEHVQPIENKATWTCRSTTGILTTSAPITETGEFKQLTSKALIQRICSPFGVTVEGEDGIQIPKYNIELDRPCSEAIAEICKFSGLITTPTPEGNIKLLRYGPELPKKDEVELYLTGNNARFEFECDSTNQGSSYNVLGQGSFNSGDLTQLEGQQDGTYPFTKRMTRISDMLSSRFTVRKEVEWLHRAGEASVESLRASIFPMTLVEKGKYVNIDSQWCRIYDGVRLIERVLYVLDKSVTPSVDTTVLGLVLPIKYGGPTVLTTGWLK